MTVALKAIYTSALSKQLRDVISSPCLQQLQSLAVPLTQLLEPSLGCPAT